MEKSQVVIFGGDYSFNAPAFTLMGQTMESVDRYKYLGLWFHESLGRPNGPRAPSRPPKSVASAYLQQRFIDEPGPGENTPVEERCIVGLWFNPDAGPDGSWVAKTRRLDENVDAETVEYYTGPSMKRLMERYCFLHKDYEPTTFRALDPGSSRSNTFADLSPREPVFYGGSGATRTDCKRGLRDSLHVP